MVVVGIYISTNQAKKLAVSDCPELSAREAYNLCNTLARFNRGHKADICYISAKAKLNVAIENEAASADETELKILLSYARDHGNDLDVQRAIAERRIILRVAG